MEVAIQRIDEQKNYMTDTARGLMLSKVVLIMFLPFSFAFNFTSFLDYTYIFNFFYYKEFLYSVSTVFLWPKRT